FLTSCRGPPTRYAAHKCPQYACEASGRTANSQAVHAQRRHTHTDRHTLPFLAASAHARIEAHVVAYHAHTVHGVQPVANQRSTLDGSGHAAIFDEIGF